MKHTDTSLCTLSEIPPWISVHPESHLQFPHTAALRGPRPPLPLPTNNGRGDAFVPDEGNLGLEDWRRVGVAGRRVFAEGGVFAEDKDGRASISGGVFGLRACGCVGVAGCRTCADMLGRVVREGDGSLYSSSGMSGLED
jgi:hypothetical protein